MATTENEELTAQGELNQCLRSLSDVVEMDPDLLSQKSIEVCRIYATPDFRHSYAEISRILESLVPDQRDSVCSHIEKIKSEIEHNVELRRSYNDDVYSEIQRKTMKLWDHVDLECVRLSRIDRVEYIGQEAKDALTAADGKLQETADKADELSDRVMDFHSQNITILGIFAGLVVAFSGVIQFTGFSMENFSGANASEILLFLSVAFTFLFNIIFLMLYCISKISGNSISVKCKKRYCVDCCACKTILGKLKIKYPYVFWFNVIALLLCIASYTLCIK